LGNLDIYFKLKYFLKESVIEFRQLKNKSIAMLNMSRTIQQQFLREGAHNEVNI